MKEKSRTDKKKTYYDKYLALQKDYLSIEELQILNEESYERSRQKMLDLLKKVKEHNNNNPDKKYRYFDSKPYKISKEFFIVENNLDEDYIYKKAKQELQLRSLLK